MNPYSAENHEPSPMARGCRIENSLRREPIQRTATVTKPHTNYRCRVIICRRIVMSKINRKYSSCRNVSRSSTHSDGKGIAAIASLHSALPHSGKRRRADAIASALVYRFSPVLLKGGSSGTKSRPCFQFPSERSPEGWPRFRAPGSCTGHPGADGPSVPCTGHTSSRG